MLITSVKPNAPMGNKRLREVAIKLQSELESLENLDDMEWDLDNIKVHLSFSPQGALFSLILGFRV